MLCHSSETGRACSSWPVSTTEAAPKSSRRSSASAARTRGCDEAEVTATALTGEAIYSSSCNVVSYKAYIITHVSLAHIWHTSARLVVDVSFIPNGANASAEQAYIHLQKHKAYHGIMHQSSCQNITGMHAEPQLPSRQRAPPREHWQLGSC